METAFQNILAILGSAGMGPHDLVQGHRVADSKRRYRPLPARCATACWPAPRRPRRLLVISALANPDWLVEIEAIAAAA